MNKAQKILVVEDDSMMLDSYKTWFKAHLAPSSNIVVQFAITGDEADRLLFRNIYNITFLDLALPGKSGEELVAAHLAKMGRLIVASAYPECGPTACGEACVVLTKPFSSDDIYTSISPYMKGVWHVNQGTDRKCKELEVI